MCKILLTINLFIFACQNEQKKIYNFITKIVISVKIRKAGSFETGTKDLEHPARRGYQNADQSYYKKADEIIEHYERCAASLIPIMQDIQAEYRYLPAELLTYVAGMIGAEAKAFSVATFYENFSFEPKGKYIIKVCDGTACHVRKSIPVKEAFMKELGLSNKKHTTDDMMFTVETVSCLGACGLAPTCMVNEEVHAKMTPEKVVELINRLRGENG